MKPEKTFLGKPYPSQHIEAPTAKKPHGTSPFLVVTLSLSLLVTSGIILAQSTKLSPSTPPSLASTESLPTTRILGSEPSTTSTTTTTPTTATAAAPTACNLASLKDPQYVGSDSKDKTKPDPKVAFDADTIFPILPSSILDSSSNNRANCSPAYWNLDIFKVLIYKVLGILNYLIFTLAIIFTVYAGVLYISGFANEANVKKAKTILITTYVGMIIALSARLILYGTINLVATDQDSKTINSTQTHDILNPTP